MPNVGEIKIKLDAVISPLLAKLKTAERGLERSARRLNRIGSTLSQNITLPVVAAGAAFVKFAADAETGFTKIDTLVGITGKALEELKTGVTGLSGQLGQSQTSLADGLFVITSAGQRSAAALETLEQASKASQLGLGAVNDVARVGVSVANAYGDSVISASTAIDQLTAAARVGNFETAQFAPAIGKVLPLAKSLGISFAEASASVATFTKSGVSAPEAITGLKSLLSNIIKPSKGAAEALESVGLSVEDLQESVKTQGLAKTLIDLTKLFDGNTTALAKIIPNVEGLVAALATAGANGEDYVVNLKSIENATGIVDDGFKKVSETANFKFNQALTNLQNSAIKLGAVLLPVVKSIIDAIQPLLVRIGNLDERWILLAARAAAVAASIGPILKAYALYQTTSAKVINLTRLTIDKFQGITETALNFASKMKGVAASTVTNFRTMGVASINFDKILRTTSIGIITVALAGLTYAVGQYALRTTTAQKSQKILEDSTKDLNREIIKERENVGRLFDVVRSTTASQNERIAAIKDLNAKYPDYLKNINLETAGIGRLAIIQKDLNNKILEGIAARKKEETTAKFYDEIIEKELKIQQIRDEGIGALSTSEKAELTFGDQSTRGGFLGLQSNEQRITEKAIKQLRNEILLLQTDATKASAAIDRVVSGSKSGPVKGVRGIGSTRVEEIEVKAIESPPTLVDLINQSRDDSQKELDEKPLKIKTAPEVDVKALAAARAEISKRLNQGNDEFEESKIDKLQTNVPRVNSDLDNLLVDATTPEEEQPQDLTTHLEQLTKLKEMENEAAAAILERNNAMTLGGEVALAMSDAMAQAAANGAASFKELAQAAVKAAAQIIRAKIQEGVASLVASQFSKGFVGLALGAAAGAAGAALFNKILGSIKVPALAGGGLAYGSTLAVVGDNPNASVDPEVIAPLSKLSAIMKKDGGGTERLETRISGNDLVILLDRAKTYLNRTN